MPPAQRTVRTATLEIAYEESGPADGIPVILMHGFPDDPRTWDGVAAPLSSSGLRVVAPWLRGYGGTGFRNPVTPRSGQQAALGTDLRDFMDALGIGRALLAGYDWGGRAACIVAALWPARAIGLVTNGGYNIQDIAACFQPAPAERELAYWYQWYFNTERGRAGLAANRRDICRMLWRMWSPNWDFDDATFARTAASWDNPDFVDVVIQSYRHRHQAASGDPALEEIERRLAARPPITVPTIVLDGAADTVGATAKEQPDPVLFPALHAHRVIPRAGHFLPREAPEPIIAAIRDLLPHDA
jgi:pimeloyl-ACP methyl ester carboxylesterase